VTDVVRIVGVEALRPHWLRLWFADGSVHEVDVGVVTSGGGVFSEIHSDPELFASVRVEERFGTIEWPGPVDLDPDVLHGDYEPASGRAYPRRVIRGPRDDPSA